MSEATHTPGPWLRIDTADYAEIHAQFRPSSQAIALVGKPGDADLIASAPELLEAAETVLAGLNERIDEACRNGGHSVPVFAGIAALSDAIARAKGDRG